MDEFEYISCHSYGEFGNLIDLCDETVVHTMTGALGRCFTDFSIELDSAEVEQLESQVIFHTIGDDSLLVVNLPSIVTLPFDTLDLECGEVTYALVNETLAEMLTLDNDTGLVTLESVSETSWVGTHPVQFVAYLSEYDPSGTQ